MPATNVIDTSIPTRDLFEIYQAFTKGDRYGHGEVASCQQFVTILDQWAPITKKRSTGDNGKRARCLVIPNLEICRKYFEQEIGHKIDWDAV